MNLTETRVSPRRADDATLAIDHLGPLLRALAAESAQELLATLRALRRQFASIDLILVEYPEGPIAGRCFCISLAAVLARPTCAACLALAGRPGHGCPPPVL